LVGVEDLRSPATAEGHLQSLQAKLCVKAVGQLPAENMPGVEIHDRHQVQESFLQWDVGDVGGPDLVRCRDLFEIHQPWKPFRAKPTARKKRWKLGRSFISLAGWRW